MTRDLSILVPSVTSRWDTFARRIQESLYSQFDLLSPTDQRRVEILVLTDNKSITLGTKRNEMVRLASGTYVAFVDDDDRLENDYLAALLAGTSSGADVLTFDVSVSLDGGVPKPCYYSIKYPVDSNTRTAYRRLPNHLMAVKREHALRAEFPAKNRGEDSAYAKRLRPFLETEHRIGRVLYHYDYSSATTETQKSEVPEAPPREPDEPIMDVVFLSRADTEALRTMTQEAINSCRAGANEPINIIVMEQIPGVTYEGATTHQAPEEFAYNTFANIAARTGTAPWIMVANNDLQFHPGWLAPLLVAENDVVSPRCPVDGRQRDIVVNTKGTQIARHFSGWCFAITRDLWERIGGFDEDFTFWCADDAVVQQVLAQHVVPMLVPASSVIHLGSITHKQAADPTGDRTWAQVWKFEQKYKVSKFQRNREYARWKYQNTRQNRRVR